MSTVGKSSQFGVVKPHYYVTETTLGKYDHLTAKKLMDVVKSKNLFPMNVLDGSLQNVGDQASLTLLSYKSKKFAQKVANPVIVTEATDTAITLKAQEGHLFRGTARHEIISRDGKLVWRVTGYGPKEGEKWWRYLLNMLFAKLGMWNLLIKIRVRKAARKIEKELSLQNVTFHDPQKKDSAPEPSLIPN